MPLLPPPLAANMTDENINSREQSLHTLWSRWLGYRAPTHIPLTVFGRGDSVHTADSLWSRWLGHRAPTYIPLTVFGRVDSATEPLHTYRWQSLVEVTRLQSQHTYHWQSLVEVTRVQSPYTHTTDSLWLRWLGYRAYTHTADSLWSRWLGYRAPTHLPLTVFGRGDSGTEPLHTYHWQSLVEVTRVQSPYTHTTDSLWLRWLGYTANTHTTDSLWLRWLGYGLLWCWRCCCWWFSLLCLFLFFVFLTLLTCFNATCITHFNIISQTVLYYLS